MTQTLYAHMNKKIFLKSSLAHVEPHSLLTTQEQRENSSHRTHTSPNECGHSHGRFQGMHGTA
jgi:hypothetical protein